MHLTLLTQTASDFRQALAIIGNVSGRLGRAKGRRACAGKPARGPGACSYAASYAASLFTDDRVHEPSQLL